MVKKTIMIFSFFIFFSGYLHADKIVIWNLKPQAGVTEKESATISSIITGEIARISKSDVISEAEMRSVIDSEQLKMSCGAEDNSCIAEIGAAMGAPLSVSGTLSKMGDYWIITLQLVDVRKVEVQSRVSKKFKGKENDLVELITPLVCELFNDKECLEKSDGMVAGDKRSFERSTPVSWKKATGWTFSVVGALVLGGGIATHVLMNNAKDDYEETGENESKYKTLRSVSIAGYVAGSVFIAGGVSLLIWDAVAKKKEKRDVSFYIVPDHEGVYAGFQGRW